ncbi:MAG: SusC/RagA family TonB-linked outer membrane protein [Gemmatimonadota bacterium]|nr:SusC/RagA family TonB-linked outer membrane protein [Gemmatimonadota bacterium]
MNRMLPFRSRQPGAKARRGPPPVPAAVLACLLAVSPAASQQSGTITGVVSDAVSGQHLESANVTLDGAPEGVLTNADGRYTMVGVVAGTHNLTFKILGYETLTAEVEVVAGETLERNVALDKGVIDVQELVVTGVARSTPKVKVPFTIDKIDVANAQVPAVSAESFLVGKVPGVKVVRGSGQPGSTASIMLRGATSISGGQAPLVVVDGVITSNAFDDLAALDIESWELIKGAAGASLYGSRAAAGVIQIRTKRGSGFAGRDYSRIIARNEVGGDQLAGDIQLSHYHPFKTDDATGQLVDTDGNPIESSVFANPDSFEVDLPDLALDGDNASTAFQDNKWPNDLELYDHISRIYTTGRFMTNYFATEGRNGETNYRASVERSTQGGVLPQWDDGFQRRGFRFNLDHKVRDYLNLSVSTAYNHINQEDLGAPPFFNLTFMAPYADLLRRDSSTAGATHCPKNGCLYVNPDPISNQDNPLYEMEVRDYRDKQQNVLASANIRWTPTAWFDLEGNFGFDKNAFDENNLTKKRPPSASGGLTVLGGLSRSQRHSSRTNAEVTASFNRAFGDLTTRTRVRYLQQSSNYDALHIGGSEFRIEGLPRIGALNPTTIRGADTILDVRAEGYYAITALDYKGKYIADAVVRRDGSSLFGADDRWHVYYRTAFAYRLSQEPWWPFASIDEFKVRWARGTAGRRPWFSAQYETYSVSVAGIVPVTLGNENLRPQQSTENEIGLDMVLFNRVETGLTYAQTTSKDQIIQVPLPKAGGYTHQVQNAGILDNSTWEFHIEAPVVNTPDIGWNVRFNLDRTRQRIDSMTRAPFRSGFFYYRDDEVFGAFYGAKFATACEELPVGVDCTNFKVNDDGLLVWTDGFDYDQGLGESDMLWGENSEEDYLDSEGNVIAVYDWGMPIKAWGECETRRQGGPGCKDFLYMGNTTPDFNVSLLSTFRWKGLSLYALFDGELGGSIYNRTRQWAYRENRSGDQDQFGKEDGRKKPVEYYSVLYNTNNLSSWFVESGNYVKLRELSLRYSLDPEMVESLFQGRVTEVEVNLIGRNLLTFTNFSGYDPEVANGNGGSDVIGRIDSYQYPNFRTFSASLQFIF